MIPDRILIHIHRCDKWFLLVISLLLTACGQHRNGGQTDRASEYQRCVDYFEKGRKLQKEENYHQAISYFDSCAMTTTQQPVVKDSLIRPVSNALIQICNSYQIIGDADECVKHLKALYPKCPLLKNTLRRDYLSILGYALSRTENMDEAEKTTLQALNKSLYLPSHDRLFRDYAYAAAVFFSNKERQPQVIEWGKQALVEAKLAKNTSGVNYVTTLLGQIYKRSGYLNEASDMFNESMKEAMERNDTLGGINALTSMADLNHYWKVNEMADGYASSAVDLAERISTKKNAMILAQAYLVKGQTVQETENSDSAMIYFQEAEKLCVGLPYNSGQVDVDLQSGIYLSQSKNDKEQQRGISHLRTVVEKATPRNRAIGFLHLGYFYLAKEQNAQAEQMLDSMFALVHSEETPIYIGIDYDRLIEYYAGKGNLGQVRHYVNMRKNEMDANDAKRLNMTLSHAIVDLKIRQGKQEMEAEQLAWEHRHTWILVGIGISILAVFAMIVFLMLRRKVYKATTRLSEVRLAELSEKIRRMEEWQNLIDDKQKQEDIDKGSIDAQLMLKDGEEAFRNNFRRLYPRFVGNLHQRVPNIGKREELLCMLVILDQNTQQVAELMGIAPSSVRMLRHRIRRKMNITQDDSLDRCIKLMVE